MEEEKVTPEETQDLPPQEKPKTSWQLMKEHWYDKIPLTLKQLDIIVIVCWILMGLLVVAIVLDALDIWSPFS